MSEPRTWTLGGTVWMEVESGPVLECVDDTVEVVEVEPVATLLKDLLGALPSPRMTGIPEYYDELGERTLALLKQLGRETT